MKSLIFALVLINASFAYEGSKPKEVWNQITSDPYEELFTQEVTVKRLASKIFKRAKDTIEQEEDIIPYFDKLLHSNGICMLGRWEIFKNNAYSGYFKAGSKAVVIARASTTLSGVKRGEKRGFGMALKLFPTDDFITDKKLKSANIFTIDTLAGNDVSHFLKSKMTNFPKIGISFNAALGLVVGKAFLLADKNPLIRQLYPISELNEKFPQAAITPKLFKISGNKNMILSDKKDFREEIMDSLDINGAIVFDIEVAGTAKKYQKIGEVIFREATASESCDHRLHFNHPVYKDDLNHIE